MTELRRITPKEAKPLMASKWLHLQLLVDKEEMQDLLSFCGDFFMFSTMGVTEQGKGQISKGAFLSSWSRYIDTLKEGNVPKDEEFRFYFTLALTKDLDSCVAIDVGQDREILQSISPIVQAQLHRFDYSFVDGKFRPMVFGPDTISWGIQLSYPQLYQSPITRQIESALDSSKFVNAGLFHHIQSWVRKKTVPTPFLAEGKRVNVPIRIGLNCFRWISKHPELQARKLEIVPYKMLQEQNTNEGPNNVVEDNEGGR